MPLQNVHGFPWWNTESREYKTIDLKNKPHGHMQVKSKCSFLEHYREECLNLQIFRSGFWMPADVSCFSGAWLILLRALESLLFRKCGPESFCVKLMSSSNLKAVCPWPVFLDTTYLSATVFISYSSSGLSRAPVFSLTVPMFQCGQSVLCTFHKVILKPWCVVSNYWHLMDVYFCTTTTVIIIFYSGKKHNR